MLLKIREATSGKVAYFIVAVISVPFALWGVSYYFQGGSDPVVMEVGSGEVTLSYYNSVFNQRKREIEATQGPAQVVSEQALRSDVLGALGREQLLILEADEYHYKVADTALAREIMETPEFLTDGEFDRQAYLDFLDTRRYSQTFFEEDIRNRMRNNQLRSEVLASEFVLPSEQGMFDKLFFQERHVRYIAFPVDHYIDPKGISSTHTETYYRANSAQFTEPDKFYLNYIEISADEMSTGLTMTEDKARTFYQNNLDFFVVPEQRTLAHILVDSGRHKQAEARANRVYEDLKRGESFAELAKEYSDDSLTAEKGGELPPLGYGDVKDERVEEVIFSLVEMEFSEPIKSSFGFQIFKLLAVESSRIQSFEKVRDIIEEQVRRTAMEKLYGEAMQRLEVVANEEWHDVGQIAAEAGVPVKLQHAGPFYLNEPKGLFQYPEIRKAIVERNMAEKGEHSGIVEVAPGHAFIFRVPIETEGAYTPSRQKSYNEVKEEIATILINANARLEAYEAIRAAERRFRSGDATFDAIAKEYALPIHDLGFIKRDDNDVPPAILQNVFKMSETAGEVAPIGMESTQAYAFVQMVGYRDAEVIPEEKQELSFGNQEYTTVIRGLIEKHPVNVHEDKLAGDITQ